VRFEFDPEKSRINRQKHGIGFDEAKKLWEGRVLEMPARDAGDWDDWRQSLERHHYHA